MVNEVGKKQKNARFNFYGGLAWLAALISIPLFSIGYKQSHDQECLIKPLHSASQTYDRHGVACK